MNQNELEQRFEFLLGGWGGEEAGLNSKLSIVKEETETMHHTLVQHQRKIKLRSEPS